MAKKAAPKAGNGKAAAAPAPAPAPPPAKAPAVKAPAAKADASAPRPKSVTKSEIFGSIAEKTGLGKKEVAGIFDALNELIAKELGKKGPGQFVIPGLLKLKVVRKPATKAKQGINPATREPMTIKAKPARNVVRAVPLKSLKELV